MKLYRRKYMEDKKTITLDFTDCKYLGELHERIRVAFNFPAWYGANLDAFWDLLWSDCDADDVLIRGVNTMSNELIEYMSKIYLILDRKVDERKKYGKLYNDIKPFSYRIES